MDNFAAYKTGNVRHIVLHAAVHHHKLCSGCAAEGIDGALSFEKVAYLLLSYFLA